MNHFKLLNKHLINLTLIEKKNHFILLNQKGLKVNYRKGYHARLLNYKAFEKR